MVELKSWMTYVVENCLLGTTLAWGERVEIPWEKTLTRYSRVSRLITSMSESRSRCLGCRCATTTVVDERKNVVCNVLLSFFPLTSVKRREEMETAKDDYKEEFLKWREKAVHPCCCSGETVPNFLPFVKENRCKKRKERKTPRPLIQSISDLWTGPPCSQYKQKDSERWTANPKSCPSFSLMSSISLYSFQSSAKAKSSKAMHNPSLHLNPIRKGLSPSQHSNSLSS